MLVIHLESTLGSQTLQKKSHLFISILHLTLTMIHCSSCTRPYGSQVKYSISPPEGWVSEFKCAFQFRACNIKWRRI